MNFLALGLSGFTSSRWPSDYTSMFLGLTLRKILILPHRTPSRTAKEWTRAQLFRLFTCNWLGCRQIPEGKLSLAIDKLSLCKERKPERVWFQWVSSGFLEHQIWSLWRKVFQKILCRHFCFGPRKLLKLPIWRVSQQINWKGFYPFFHPLKA